MFVNEVSFEARGRDSDGVEIIVTEIVSATSDISYEDAWLKAHALAKEKAEATLVEKLKLLTGEVKEKIVYLKGEKGCAGSRGPQGQVGSSSSSIRYTTYKGQIPTTLANQILELSLYKSGPLPLSFTTLLCVKNALNEAKGSIAVLSSSIMADINLKTQNITFQDIPKEILITLFTSLLECDIKSLISNGVVSFQTSTKDLNRDLSDGIEEIAGTFTTDMIDAT